MRACVCGFNKISSRSSVLSASFGGRRGWGGCVRVFFAGDVLAVVEDAAGGAELLVVSELDDRAHVDVLAHAISGGGEVEDAIGLGVGGEPVFAVDLLVVGGEGGLEVFFARAGVLGDGFAVDEDDLEVLLVDPDAALEVVVVLLDVIGPASKT